MISSLATLELVLEVAAIQSLALAVLFFFRRISAATQHRLLAATVVAVIVVTLVSPFVSGRHLGLIPVEDASLRSDFNPPPGSVQPGAPLPAPDAQAVPAGRSPAAPSARAVGGVLDTLGTVWLTGSALVILWIVGGMAYGWRLSRLTRRSENAHLTGWLRWALEQVGVRADIPLFESERLRIPVVSGWMRPRVILPAHAAGWSEERMRAVLLHESAHIRRGDIAYQFLAKLTCAMHWFNPLAWLVERKLFLASERAADNHVIRRDVSAAEYAEHLMAASEELGVERTPLWATAAMAEGTAFKDRILSILDPNARRGEPDRSDRAILALAAVAVVVSVTTLSPWGPVSPAEAPAPVSVVSDSPPALQQPQQDVEVLIAMLRMRDANMREHAAEALGHLGDPRAVVALMDVVRSDADASVREHAAESLGHLGDADAVAALTDVVRNDTNASVREHAAEALGYLGDSRARAALVTVVGVDRDDGVREHAVVALGRLKDPAAYEFLLETMHGRDVERVRAHAAYALGLLGDVRALEPLLAALRNGSRLMRANAALGLGELGDPRALDVLREASSDPDAEVRRRAAEAIGMIRGRR